MKRLRLNRWLITLVAFGLVLLVYRPEVTIPPKKVPTKIPDSDFYMEGITIKKFNTSGIPINILIAEKMEHSSKLDLSILDKPVITFGKNSQEKWELRSERGTLTNKSRTIKLESDVNIEEYISAQTVRTKITTDELTINLENNVASTDKKIVIENPYYHTQAIGLEVNLGELSFDLKSDITTKIYY